MNNPLVIIAIILNILVLCGFVFLRLKEIDKLHAMLMQVLEEVEKLREGKGAYGEGDRAKLNMIFLESDRRYFQAYNCLEVANIVTMMKKLWKKLRAFYIKACMRDSRLPD